MKIGVNGNCWDMNTMPGLTLDMIIGEAVNVMIGIRANGNCKDMSTLRPSLRLVKSPIPLETGEEAKGRRYQLQIYQLMAGLASQESWTIPQGGNG